MWSACVLVFWAVSAGVVTAGLLSSLYSLVTAEPVTFRALLTGGLVVSMLSMPLLLLAGPLVIARNAWRNGVVETRAWSFVAATGAIVLTWSFINGVVVLEFLLALRGALA
jgi:hypothetical protein